MEDAKQKLLDMNINGTIVSVIVERERDGDFELLLQTRWKPERDPVYSGAMEIPAGGIHAYEDIYDAAKREVWEETGLRVTRFDTDIQTPICSPKNDDCFAFVPFCCQQQLKGGIPRIRVVFICQVGDGEVKPGEGDVRETTRVSKGSLREIVEKHPERIFTLQLPVLKYYLQERGRFIESIK